MKKLLVLLFAMAVAISFGSAAMAKDGLSVDLGIAWNFNGADMGKTIVKDGEAGVGIETRIITHNIQYITGVAVGKLIMPENELLAASKDATVKKVIQDVEDNGTMQGLNIALRGRYDFLNSFFVRLGFSYDKKLMGGETSYKFGSTASQLLALGIVGITSANTNLAAGLASLNGQKVSQKWDYACFEIPLTVGINVPLSDGKYNLYAGIGLTYYTGYWQLEMTVPKGYAFVLTYLPQTGGDNGVTVTDAATEKVKFEASGIGFNWTVGASAEVASNVSVFVEWDAKVAGGMSDSVKLKTDAAKAGFGVDNVYYPVNLSTSLIRFGASYYIMAL